MQELLSKLSKRYPEINFTIGPKLSWWHKTKTIVYPDDTLSGEITSGLLHELGHATLEHSTYASDIDLLLKERDAWGQAKKIAEDLNIKITNEHIEDCLDTYREWVYKRSVCPQCSSCGFQPHRRLYKCLNCDFEWKVTYSRNCRPYRLKSAQK